MGNTRPLRIVILASALAGVYGCTRPSATSSSPQVTAALLPGLELVKFAERRRHTLKGLDISEYSGSAGAGDIAISRIDGIERAAAERLLRQKTFAIQTLTLERTSPYPGEISTTVRCDGPTFQPRVERFENSEFMAVRAELAANSRRALGICGDSEFALDAVVLYLYCKQARQFIEVESFFPRQKKPPDWLKKPACSSSHSHARR